MANELSQEMLGSKIKEAFLSSNPNKSNKSKVLGAITQLAQYDQEKASQIYGNYNALKRDSNSVFYDPYSAPTNQAVSNLAALGFDTNNLNKGFIDQNRQWISSNLIYSGTTNTPSKPGKKATADQRLAYELYQWDKSEDQTAKAEQERQDAIKEARYWAGRTDRNYSDDEIIGKVKEDFAKKYPTLAKMQGSGFAPLELNRAVDYSDDTLYGAIWAGRNGYDGDDMDAAIGYRAAGMGKQWEYNPEIENKLNPESEDFHPYSLGSTNLDKQARYFGVSAFSKQWVKDHEQLAFSDDETEREMYGKVRAAYDNQVKAEQEYDELMKFIEKKAQWAEKPEDILSKIDWKKYPTLAAMDKSIGNKDLDILATGELIPLTEGLAYRYADLKKYVGDLFAEKNQINSIIDYAASMSDITSAALADITAGISAPETNAEGGKQEPTVASHPTFRPSEEQIEVAKAQDKRLKEDAELTEDVNTPAETAVNTTQLSSQYDNTKDIVSQVMRYGGQAAIKSLAETTYNGNIKSYSGTVLGNFGTVSNYEINEKQIADLEEKAESLRSELGDKIYYSEEFPQQKIVQVTINGQLCDVVLDWNQNASEKYNEETGEMDRTGSYQANGIFKHGTDLREPPDVNYTHEEYEQAVSAAIEENNKGMASFEKYRAEGLSDEDKEKVKEYNQTVGDLESAQDRRANGQEAYDKAKKEIEIAQQTQEHTIEMMKKAGLDTRSMEDAAVVTDFFLNFTKYDPTDWQSHNFYHEYSQMLMSGEAGIDEMLKVAEAGDAEIQQAIDVAKTMLEYADEKGMGVPDDVRENITRYIESLERQHQDYDYMSYMKNDDFQEKARAGAERIQNTEFDWDAYGKTGTLESQPLWGILSEEQKNILRKYEENYKNGDSSSEYLVKAYETMAAGLSLDRTFNELGFATGSYLASDIMNDYEQATYYYLLETQGTEAAEAYYNHLADGSYGVLNKRAAEKTQAAASDLASKGFWGRRAADALSILLSPIAALGSAYYTAEYGIRKLSGERVEFNPNNVNLTANIYKKEARAKINEEIIKTYGEGTPLQKIMSGLQEIISTRGDSMMNALVFGPLFKGIDSSILQEFLSAAPMALTAATDAVAEAKENGVADDVNLLGIFASTFIAEAGTEAISLENMKEVFQGAKDLTIDGISDFMRNWLTNSGISEMVGETFTEVWEQEWNKALLGENSDYEKMWRKIHDEEKVSEEEAKLRASRELMGQVLHTALISYITPGADIVSYGAGRFAAYRGRARELQEAGQDYSVLDVYRAYKEEKQRNKVNQPVVESEASEQEAGTAVPETTQETPTETVQEAPAHAEQKTADEIAQSLTLDYEILESARGADVASQTASVAAVLDVDGNDLSSDEANAAAANLPGLFGENTTPAEGVQTLIVGSYANGVDVDSVKQAIRTAALDKESAAYQMMQSEEYQDADPGERAEMLASTVEIDANDSGVQNRVAKSIHENRVARAEKEAVNSPEVSQKQKTAYEAQGKLLDAQKELEAAQTYSDQKNALVEAAGNNIRTVDPTDNAALNKAISELQSATAVAEEEAKPRLAKAKEAERKAQEALDRAVQDIATTKRQIAEQLVAEQDRQRGENEAIAKVEAEEQAIAEEERQINQDEEDNAVLSDREAFVEKWAAEHPGTTEEDKQHLREQYDKAHAERAQQPVANQQETQPAQQHERDEFGNMNDEKARRRKKFYDDVSRKFKVNIEIVDSKEVTKRDTGKSFYFNGRYDKANNRILLDKNVTQSQAMYFVLAHELTHVAEAAGTYKQLANTMLKLAYGDETDFDTVINNLKANNGRPTTQAEADLVEKWQKRYESITGDKMSYEDAANEMIADYMGALFNGNDQSRQDLVARLVAADPGVAKRMLNSIKSFLKKAVGMKGAWKTNIQKTVDMFESALNTAQKGKAVEQKTPTYQIRKSGYSDNLTVRFDSAPSEAVNTALRGLGMVPYRDSKGNWGWRFGKGVKLSEAQIQYTIKQAMKEESKYSIGPVPGETESVNTEDNVIAKDDDGNALATELPGGTVTINTDSKYSLNSFTPEEQARVRQALLDKKDANGNKEFTEAEVDKYMNDAMSIAKLIADDRQRLDFEASDNQVFLKPNNDYYFTLDASTLCAKRLLYQGTFDYVQHALPDEVFTPSDLIDLANIMNEMGYETPCGICYVESRRRWLDTYAQKFLDELPTDADGFIDKYFKKATAEEKAAIRERFTTDKPSIDDLTTSDGLEKLRHSDKYMYKAFVDEMNHKGTSNPKVVQLRTEYRGDIVKKMTKNDIQKVKDIGGLRIQSFSDFETPHLLDMVQAVYDMASVGLTSQAYTKVPNFAWVFGDTGIKINLSLIGKGTGLDENGNLVFDNREGMNFDEAMRLRERYNKNVGTILVGINDDHIIAAMGDHRIDFIIPFHKSGWSQEELSKMATLNNYSDYTSSQNELMIVGDRKHRVKEIKNLGVKALDNWIVKEGNDHPGYQVIDNGNGKYTVTYDIGYETESFKTHKERTGEKLSNFEPVGANQYWDFSKSGEWNARKYLKMCAESGRIPKFSQFLVDNGDGTFSLPEGKDKRSTSIREGYWKTLIDFKMYENDGYGRTTEDGKKTEVRGSAQQEVTPNINMNEAYRVMNEHQLGRQMPDKENGQKGAFLKMKSNNDVPVATDAGDYFIDLIRRKREGNNPTNPDDTLHASPSIDVGSLGPSAFHQGPSDEINMNARTAFGATEAPAVLGNEGVSQEEEAPSRQAAMAIDAETGETVRKYSLPSDNDLDQWFEQYIDGLSADELDQLAQDMFGIPLNRPSVEKEKATQGETKDDGFWNRSAEELKTAYKNAVNDGDYATANRIIDGLAKKAGYTVRGTHRTNEQFTVFDKSKRSGKRGKTLGDGFYVAAGEGTEYDNDSYGKNRMLVYINPGRVFNIQDGGLTEEEAKRVYDKYFAPSHPNAVGDDNPYTAHVIGQLQKSSKVMDYIKEAADNADTTTDEVFKWLGYNSIKDGPQYCVFDSEQIKSAEPVTYNDNGEMIDPFDSRFDKGNQDIRYSLPSDAPYLAAVERGEMDEAQKMVDKAANDNGYTVRGYHGTSKQFTVFDKTKSGQNWNGDSRYGPGLYFAHDRDTALNWTDGVRVIDSWLKIDRPLDLRGEAPEDIVDAIKAKAKRKLNDYDPSFPLTYEQYQANLDRIANIEIENPAMFLSGFKYGNDGKMTDGIREFLSSLGYDGIITDDEIVVFDPSQVKSADPVTYDDEGNVIPLSERFNEQKEDIRYSLPSDDVLQEQIKEYMDNGGSIPYNAPQAAPSDPNNGFRQWGNEGAQESDELDEKAKQYVLNSEYARDTNAAEMARALKWVRGNKQFADDDGFQESMRIVTGKRFNYRTKDGQARMVAVMALAVARGDVGAQVQLADAYNQQGTDLGQALQARKLFRLMTPQGRIATLQKMVGNVQQQLDSKGIQKEIRLSDWIYQAASEATEEGEFSKIQQAAAAELAEQIPANWKDRLRSLRMLSMLGNPRTHIRNIIGNALFIPAVSIKNKLGAIGEIASNKITGNTERTKTLSLKLSKEISDFARQDAEFMKDDLTGESKYNEGSLVQRQQKPFKGFIQSLIDFNSNALEAEDWFFLKGHYRRALGGWMQANGYTVEQLKENTDLLEQGRAYAINEAQKATYRDFNGLADRLNKLSRNPETTGQKVLGFAVDAVLPFKKTPANILKRGIEYSPAGLVRGIKNAMVDVKSGKITAAQAIDRICSGLAGTAILALGAFLGHAGIVTCGLGDDEDKFEKEQGNQKYAVHLKLFGQDVTYTMDWAAPMSMPFFVGAAIENQINKNGDLDINGIVDAFSNIAEPVLNLSMLDGVNTLMKTSQNADTDSITQIGAKVLSNYATSYVPSLLGALARTIDDTRRANFVESGKGGGVTGIFNYAAEQTENKIPWLSRSNIPVRDVFGNAETSGLVERIIENFISPGYISNYKNDPVLNEMARLYDANVTGSKDMIPKDPAKTVTYNKQKYVFSAEEWDKYKEVRGKTAYKMLTDLMKNSDYQNAEESVQVQMIKSAWDYADKAGKAAVIPGYKLNTKDKNPAASVAKDGKITGYKNKMLAALEDGDYEGYEAMVEGLREEDVEDSEIKAKISGKYRDLYKDAYLTGDYGRMNEIEEILDNSGFDFDYDKWQDQVDEKRDSGSIGTVASNGRTKISFSQYDPIVDRYGSTGLGNIDLNNRQVVQNDDGSISTERSMSFYDEDTGKEVLIPTVIDGRIVSEDEAIDHYYETGEYLGMFDTPEEADTYADLLHRRQDWYYNR